MKTGIIVYVLGNVSMNEEFNEKSAIEGLGVPADRVAFVFSGEKNDDIAYHWWDMTRKGMSRIICMAGMLNPPSQIRLTGKQLQLCGF
jgi:hypothetical protein